jgi:hypothetical protein
MIPVKICVAYTPFLKIYMFGFRSSILRNSCLLCDFRYKKILLL